MSHKPTTTPATIRPSIPYLPHVASNGVLAMGLSRLEAKNWIEVDGSIGEFHRHKRVMAAADFPAVYAEAGDSREAQQELAELLDGHLLGDHSSHYARAAYGLHCAAGDFTVADDEGSALWRSSLKIADDIALMQSQRGVYHLIAASLCSPSHWRLADKIGRPMREVHEPIPGIHDELSKRIDRFFEHLRPGDPVRRFNWSLQWGDELFCPGHGQPLDGELHYRAERQSLLRLPVSEVIVFTIRVYRCPVRELATVAGAVPSLLKAVENTPAALASYKGFHRYRDTLRALSTDLV